MEVLYPRCAGLDVHKDTVVAAVRCVSAPRQHEVRSFATTTAGLLGLADWLAGHGCTHVAMEATGVYRKPVWHVLEGVSRVRRAPVLRRRSLHCSTIQRAPARCYQKSGRRYRMRWPCTLGAAS